MPSFPGTALRHSTVPASRNPRAYQTAMTVRHLPSASGLGLLLVRARYA